MHDLLQFFRYGHPPPHLREVSKPFCDLATRLVKEISPNPELTVALSKLMEAKDCAVRAVLYEPMDTTIPGAGARSSLSVETQRQCQSPH